MAEKKIALDTMQIGLLLLYKQKEQSVETKAIRNITVAMGSSAVSFDTAKVWLRKFRIIGFDLRVKSRSGRTAAMKDEHLWG